MAVIFRAVPAEEKTGQAPAPSLAPRRGVQMMALILIGMALLAVYSNVQRARRDQIETVTIIPAPPRPTPNATPVTEEP